MSSKGSVYDSVFGRLVSRKRFLIVGATLLLLSLIVFGFINAARRSLQPATDSVVLSRLPPSKRVPGQRIVYELDYSGKAVADFSSLTNQASSNAQQQPNPAQQAIQTSVTGPLVATVLQSDPDASVVSYALRGASVRVTVNGQESEGDAQQAQQDLGSEVYASIDQQGRVSSVQFASATGNLAQTLARSLLAALQFVGPTTGSSDLRQWQSEEEDANGKYQAAYRLDESAGNDAEVLTYSKNKLSYFQPPPSRPNARVLFVPMTITPKGQLLARFDARAGQLLELTGTEMQTISVSGHTIAVSEVSLRCNRVATEILSKRDLDALRSERASRALTAITTALFVPSGGSEDETAEYSNELGDATLDSLIAELKTAEANPVAPEQRAQLYNMTRALVHLHPEVCPTMANILSTAAPGSLTMQVMLAALSAAGHPAAQVAITEIMRARADDGPALAALTYALGSVAEPTEASEAQLRDLASNSRNARVLAVTELSLGMMAANLESTGPERARRIVNLLTARLESSPDVRGKQRLLSALGNAGTQEALDVVARYLQSDTPDLRASAIATLCRSEPEDAEELLMTALTRDADDSVRLQAAREFQLRDMSASSFEAQKEAFLNDKSTDVRLTLLSNLWQAQRAFPEARSILKRAALNDSSKNIREAAAKILVARR